MTNNISIPQDIKIDKPIESHWFSVRYEDWRQLKKFIGLIDFKPGSWENAGWFLSSTTIALAISYFTITNNKFFLGIFTVVSLTATIAVFYIAKMSSKQNEISKKLCLEEMKQIEKSVQIDPGDEKLLVYWKILEAKYGTIDNYYYIDYSLTRRVKNNCLNVIVSNDLAGDPDPGIKKTLFIKFSIDGDIFEETYNEGEALSLP